MRFVVWYAKAEGIMDSRLKIEDAMNLR